MLICTYTPFVCRSGGLAAINSPKGRKRKEEGGRRKEEGGRINSLQIGRIIIFPLSFQILRGEAAAPTGGTGTSNPLHFPPTGAEFKVLITNNTFWPEPA